MCVHVHTVIEFSLSTEGWGNNALAARPSDVFIRVELGYSVLRN
jgi:hypothetical protein